MSVAADDRHRPGRRAHPLGSPRASIVYDHIRDTVRDRGRLEHHVLPAGADVGEDEAGTLARTTDLLRLFGGAIANEDVSFLPAAGQLRRAGSKANELSIAAEARIRTGTGQLVAAAPQADAFSFSLIQRSHENIEKPIRIAGNDTRI